MFVWHLSDGTDSQTPRIRTPYPMSDTPPLSKVPADCADVAMLQEEIKKRDNLIDQLRENVELARRFRDNIEIELADERKHRDSMLRKELIDFVERAEQDKKDAQADADMRAFELQAANVKLSAALKNVKRTQARNDSLAEDVRYWRRLAVGYEIQANPAFKQIPPEAKASLPANDPMKDLWRKLVDERQDQRTRVLAIGYDEEQEHKLLEEATARARVAKRKRETRGPKHHVTIPSTREDEDWNETFSEDDYDKATVKE